MLRLKEVELLGFKSFADRTRLICDGTTAAVVGPNGCGKSNLSDAVSWVLGEQSARMLRGERMSDVIFNGTSRRPPTGMAEVSIVLAETGDECEGVDELERVMAVGPQWGQGAAAGEDAADGHAATVTGVNGKPAKRRAGDEIKVTRRLFRSGESEYLLNGSLCRLRDIQDIFMGTGLGPESYAIIEQGRIGQILSSKPADRRSIIEEAAGVSKFKTRKRLAEAKLESSRQNLARINDILEEISKQASSLKRQASKAERYKELREDLRACQKLVFVSKLTSLEAERQRLAEALSAIQGEMAAAAAELETLESGRNAAASRFEELEEDLKRTREALMRSELESERMRSSLARAREQAAALGMRSAESRAGQLRLEEQAAALDKESLARSQHSAMVRAEMGGACGAAQELASRQTELAALLAAGESDVETLRREMLLAVSRISEIRNETVKAEEAGLSAGRDLARVEAERAEAEKELQYFSQELDAIRASYALDKEALAGLQASAVNARAALDAGRKEAADLAAEAERLRHEFDRASARRQAVGESLARHAYSTESVRSLLSTPNEAQNFHPLGVLADFLEVSPGYEAVVEEMLKAQLDCVVVERLPEARQGIAMLKSGGGRSTFFIKDYPQRGSEQDLDEEDGQEAKAREGVVAQLSEVVRFDARLGLNGTSVFPSLGRSFVVESPLAAERLAAEFPFCHFITLEGEHYHQRWVSGGKGATAGPLALRREYRDLDRRAGEIESAIAACEQRWSESKDRLKGREDELQEFEAARNDAEKRVMLAGEKLRQADESAARAGMRASTHERERSLLQAECEKTGLLVLQLKAELETAGAAREFKEKEIEAAAGSVRSRRDELDAMNQSLTAAQVKLSALEERMQAADADEKRVVAEAGQAREQLSRLATQSAEWDAERARLVSEADAGEAILKEAGSRERSLRDEIELRELEAQSQRASRDELAPQAEAARARMEAVRAKRSEVEIDQARAASGLEHHAGQCREELGLEPEALRAAFDAGALLTGEGLQSAEENVRELKGKIDRLGPVNMMALEELEEASGRLAFLDGQRQDLLASIQDTAATITEIDTASRRKFMDAFNAINGFFADSFRTLFGGGAGEMRFSDSDDPESGIDLVAQPPGKRLQNVLLLSGGEKALTALALLIAVFRFSPSPFCILDEVDAPLDEANVARFALMIQSMSEQTQFILITHNKRTMEACRIMYGVTMEEPGVSRLVSVRFEARELEPVAPGA